MKKSIMTVLTVLFLSHFLSHSVFANDGIVTIDLRDMDKLTAVCKMGTPYKYDGSDLTVLSNYTVALKNAGMEAQSKAFSEKLNTQKKLMALEKEGFISFGLKEIKAFLKFHRDNALPKLGEGYYVRDDEWFSNCLLARHHEKSNYSFDWNETKVENYSGTPPLQILNKIKEIKDKGIFDYLTIATFEAKEIKKINDPLLLGRINGSDQRFFIAEWGGDIKIEDLVKPQ